jgi:hypothetical protein
VKTRTTSLVASGNNVDRLAAGCAAIFIVVLGIAAYWDSSIRVLHAFEACRLVFAVLCLRQRKLGLHARRCKRGLVVDGDTASFVRNGFERLAMLVSTGHVDRWDQFIAAPAALSTGGLVVFSLWGYSRVRPKAPVDLVVFMVVLAIVALVLVMLFWLFAPQYMTLFARLVKR